MIHNKNNKKKRAFTLVEMIVTVAILTFLAIYAWRIYFSGSETMRHTVSQSQIQSDMRVFLDKLEAEMMACYAFDTVDTENKKFSFYTFTYGKKPLDDIYYDDYLNLRKTDNTSDASLQVLKIEYSWADGKVTKVRTPGNLYFLHEPIEFEPTPNSNAFGDGEKAATLVPLKDISEFEVKGYSQELDPDPSSTGIKITPVTPATASSTMFIVLRLHALKDEGGHKRDEEIDLVTKFYSSIRLAEAANPGYFCSTDHDGRF